MTVKELRKRLIGVPDNMEVVTHHTDHTYLVTLTAEIIGAELYRGHYYEYFDEVNMSDGGQKMEVFLIS